MHVHTQAHVQTCVCAYVFNEFVRSSMSVGVHASVCLCVQVVCLPVPVVPYSRG